MRYTCTALLSNMYQCCPAEGFFTAVGTEDWEAGYSCGTCAELQYGGNTVTVNVVDRQGHRSQHPH